MSVWQTPQACRRTSTSPGPGPSRSTSWTTSGWANSSRTAARIFMAPTLTAAGPAASTVQRGLLLGVGERPGGGRTGLLAEVKAHLARRPQALGVIGAERGAGGVQRQRAEHVAAEVALLATRLLALRARLRHPVPVLLVLDQLVHDGAHRTTSRPTPATPVPANRIHRRRRERGASRK